MNQTFYLPDLGEGLTEASIVAWLVEVGDVVRVDQAIAEVETAKSIVELPSPFAGTVAVRHGEVGDVVAVGGAFVEVAAGAVGGGSGPVTAEIATVTIADDARELEAYRAEERAGSGDSGSGNVLIGYGTSTRDGAPRRGRARVSYASLPGVAVRTGAAGAVKSPIVRQLARELGVDVGSVAGTGVDGVVTRSDVLAAQAGAPVRLAAPRLLGEATRERMSPLRRAVSAKLSTSRREIPEATVWVDVDVTDLWAMRAQMGSPAPSFTALAARFVLLALGEYPLLASRIDGEEIVTFDAINLGVATNTDRGLMVPVIARADSLNVGELDEQLREVAGAARAGRLAPDQLAGSTITFNNYGALGVDGSAAIINYPEVAIVGMGRAIERPWVIDGVIVPRRIVQVSLVFDHRVCDGGYAAGFLGHLVTSLERPAARYRGL